MKFNTEKFITLVNQVAKNQTDLNALSETEKRYIDFQNDQSAYFLQRMFSGEKKYLINSSNEVKHQDIFFLHAITKLTNQNQLFFIFQIYEMIYMQNLIEMTLQHFCHQNKNDLIEKISDLTVEEMQTLDVFSQIKKDVLHKFALHNTRYKLSVMQCSTLNKEYIAMIKSAITTLESFGSHYLQYLREKYCATNNFLEAMIKDYIINVSEDDFIMHVSSLCHMLDTNHDPTPYSLMMKYYKDNAFIIDSNNLVNRQLQYISCLYTDLDNTTRAALHDLLTQRLQIIKKNQPTSAEDESYLRSLFNLLNRDKEDAKESEKIKIIVKSFEDPAYEVDFKILNALLKKQCHHNINNDMMENRMGIFQGFQNYDISHLQAMQNTIHPLLNCLMQKQHTGDQLFIWQLQQVGNVLLTIVDEANQGKTIVSKYIQNHQTLFCALRNNYDALPLHERGQAKYYNPDVIKENMQKFSGIDLASCIADEQKVNTALFDDISKESTSGMRRQM